MGERSLGDGVHQPELWDDTGVQELREVWEGARLCALEMEA